MEFNINPHKFNRLSLAKKAINRLDEKLARQLLLPLAKKGNREAQFLMGYFYFCGFKIGRNEAYQWLKRAAKQNQAEALYYLATTNFKEAQWSSIPESKKTLAALEKAATLGSGNAARDIGCAYAWGDTIVPKDLSKTRHWYQIAANLGNTTAQFDLGCMLLYGEGGDIEIKPGLDLLRQCAEKENSLPESEYAATHLARFYSGVDYPEFKDRNEMNYWQKRKDDLSEKSNSH